MKRIPLLVLSSVFALNAFANKNLCGYVDHFQLSDATHPGINIIEANSNQDIYVQVISPRSFELRDTEQCRSGYAHVGIAYDTFHWCRLDIKDGPFMNHPTVKHTCSGLFFEGISYEGWGTHEYILHFH